METIYTQGLWFKEPRDGAPSYVRGSLSIKAPDFIAFLEKHQNNGGYINIDILEGREKGTFYGKLNVYKPTAKVEPKDEPIIDPSDGRDLTPDADIPF